MESRVSSGVVVMEEVGERGWVVGRGWGRIVFLLECSCQLWISGKR